MLVEPAPRIAFVPPVRRPVSVTWRPSPVWDDDDPWHNGPHYALNPDELPIALVAGAHGFCGPIRFDFWVTETENFPWGSESTHHDAPNLVWDWETSHPGQPATHTLSSPLELAWPKRDNQGHDVPPGRYYAYLLIRRSPTGFCMGAHARLLLKSAWKDRPSPGKIVG